MNKKMIALAVAGVMAAPIASAAPTVYGRAQVEIASFDETGADSERGMSDNGQGRIGIKGSEDLGGGLKAVYNLEWGTDTSDNQAAGATSSTATVVDTTASTTVATYTLTDTTAGSPFKSRTSIIGLKGSFGEVTFGRQTSPYGRTNLDSGYNATELQARGNGAQIGSSAYGNGSFASETINYKGKFGGAVVRAMISANDTDKHKDDSAFSVDWKGGPLRIVAAVSTDGNGTTETDRTKLGAQYKMGAWKFTAQVESDEVSNGGAENDYTMLMADFTMGKNIITARLAEQDPKGGKTVDHTMVAVKHKFSKKTSAWVGVMSVEDNNSSTEYDVTSVGMQVKF